MPAAPSQKDMEGRLVEDEITFTIDGAADAKDLDDAVHIEGSENGNLELSSHRRRFLLCD